MADYQYQKGKWYRFVLVVQGKNRIPRDIKFPGNYAIFSDVECIYVGESSDLHKRLHQHITFGHLPRAWNTKWGVFEALVIAVRKERYKFERLTYEARLIYKIRPAYNLMDRNK